MDRQAWRDFFVTVTLLGISFVIAVLSSIAAQQNAVKLGAISAAISLILAVIGAVYILPRLARRVQLEFIRFAVRTTVTVEGLFFLALLVVVGFAAWNTANNLLYLILSAMLAFLFAANFISRLSLSDLSIQLRFPDHIFAGEQATLALTTTNHKRFIPTFSVMIEPLSEPASTPSGRTQSRVGNTSKGPNGKKIEGRMSAPGDASGQLVAATGAETSGIAGGTAKTRLAKRKQKAAVRNPSTLGKLAHFILVPPGASAKQKIEHRFDKRGCYPITAFRVSTKFPTGFFKKWRRIEAAGEIVVYPKPKPLDDFYHTLPMITGQVTSFARGSGDDLFRIRHYHPSDHMRHIDWKATAKSRGLMVRDHTREDERRLTIVFDTSRPASAGGGGSDHAESKAPAGAASADGEKSAREVFEQSFETAVVMAASLANHFILEGSDVELITARPEGSVEADKGVDHLYSILRVLATLTPDPLEREHTEDEQENHRRSRAAAARGSTGTGSARHEYDGRPRAFGAAGRRSGQEVTLWQMLDAAPILSDERRFKVLITSAQKGTIPANIWRSAHVVFMEDLR